MKYDYIIVGQGLAGTALAYLLLKRKKKIVIIDEVNVNSSSRVAVGLFNPFTGRKMVKTWNADVIFPFFHEVYREMEIDFNAKFFYPVGMLRPFRNKEEQNDWIGKSALPGYDRYIEKMHTRPVNEGELLNPYGSVALKSAGYLHVTEMLDKARQYFTRQAEVISTQFDYDKIEYSEEKVVYKNIEARSIVFCDGANAVSKGYFQWLPFRPVKGEVLYLDSAMDMATVYNRGCFITPKINGLHRCGSTYNWRDLTTAPTDEGKTAILEKLKDLISTNVKVVDQKAGIRPASADRRPIIGRHPEKKNFIIFNGLGTKGVSLAPYCANQLINCLEEGKILDSEVNIERYNSLYYHTLTN